MNVIMVQTDLLDRRVLYEINGRKVRRHIINANIK